MKFGKRQLVLAALVVALGAAVYLNWQFSDNDIISSTSVSDSTKEKELGDSLLVNSTTNGEKKTENTTETKADGEKVQDNSAGENNNVDSATYFATAKTERQKAQDEMTELAQEVLKSAEESAEAKVEAVAQAAAIAKNIETQSNIESLIKAKGFTECLAFIQNEECVVTVLKAEMSDEKIVVIKDIISGQAGISFDKIKITEI